MQYVRSSIHNHNDDNIIIIIVIILFFGIWKNETVLMSWRNCCYEYWVRHDGVSATVYERYGLDDERMRI